MAVVSVLFSLLFAVFQVAGNIYEVRDTGVTERTDRHKFSQEVYNYLKQTDELVIVLYIFYFVQFLKFSLQLLNASCC